MSKSDLKLDWASHDAAKYACQRWHYSKCMPIGKLVKIGVWEKGRFIGVVIFGRGASSTLIKKYGLDMTEGCELQRVALKSHKAEVSRVIAIALRMLRTSMNGLRLIVSFADKAVFHHGGIYQAGNWVYTGETQYKQEFIYKAKRVSDRTISALVTKLRATRTELEENGVISRIPTLTKHRYLMPLDKEMREKVQKLSKPYPKRTKHAMPETIGTAAGKHRPVRSNIEAA